MKGDDSILLKTSRGRKLPYDVRTESIDCGVGFDRLVMKKAYSKEGVYIGSSRLAWRLFHKYHIDEFYRANLGENICSIGFSSAENKWYGWSHRALYGFSVGSECKKGDCHYLPRNFDEAMEDYMRFFGEFIHGEQDRLEFLGRFDRAWKAGEILMGRGEWVAKTMEDARQMAVDFARSVA